MKALFSLLALALLLAGCTRDGEVREADVVVQAPSEELGLNDRFVNYGADVAAGSDLVALAPATLTADPLAYDGTTVRVEGSVTQVCRMKGCWLSLDNPTDTPVRVMVPRDENGQYVFTFPPDLPAASDAVVEGTVRVDTMSVDMLRHLAEDQGRPQAEIDAITEPEPTVALIARGALLRTPEAASTVQS
ncbi:MAG: DUF4920 domain-containing protein [Bacteroidota bacterium]